MDYRPDRVGRLAKTSIGCCDPSFRIGDCVWPDRQAIPGRDISINCDAKLDRKPISVRFDRLLEFIQATYNSWLAAAIILVPLPARLRLLLRSSGLQEMEHFNRQREDDGRVLLRRDFGQRLQVAQGNRHRLGGDDAGRL